jgi:hypothetical protein
MKVDGCGSSGFEGENLDDDDGIFHFEEEQVWMVLRHIKAL